MGHPQSAEYGRRQSISKCENQLRRSNSLSLAGGKWNPFDLLSTPDIMLLIKVSDLAVCVICTVNERVHVLLWSHHYCEDSLIGSYKVAANFHGKFRTTNSRDGVCSCLPSSSLRMTLSLSVKVAADFIRSNRRIFTRRPRPQEWIDSFIDCASDTHDCDGDGERKRKQSRRK